MTCLAALAEIGTTLLAMAFDLDPVAASQAAHLAVANNSVPTALHALYARLSPDEQQVAQKIYSLQDVIEEELQEINRREGWHHSEEMLREKAIQLAEAMAQRQIICGSTGRNVVGSWNGLVREVLPSLLQECCRDLAREAPVRRVSATVAAPVASGGVAAAATAGAGVNPLLLGVRVLSSLVIPDSGLGDRVMADDDDGRLLPGHPNYLARERASGEGSGTAASGTGQIDGGDSAAPEPEGPEGERPEREDTSITQGRDRAPEVGEPDSIYERLDDNGTVRSRTFYDRNGRQFSRQDFSGRTHRIQGQDVLPHEHLTEFNAQGQPVSREQVRHVPSGYSNIPNR